MLRKKRKSKFKSFIKFIDDHPYLAPVIGASIICGILVLVEKYEFFMGVYR
ncbi:MAG: hypothetical protein ACRC92_27000 [Peptostreptococcaceae bacterium]